MRGVDKEALRHKYLQERDKRLRPDGNDQYLPLTGQLAHYLDDPYTPVGRARAEAPTTSRSRSSAAASPAWSPAPG